MSKLLYLLIPVLCCAFLSKENSPAPKKSYDVVKTSILSKRNQLNDKLQKASTSSDKKKVLMEAGRYLHTSLVDTIFPYWYGTTWDFNGYTDKPREGMVACGYFVSTPLKHCGLNVNRFKLAQKYSLEIVKKLSCGDTVISFHGINSEQFLQKTKGKLKEGLYVVGLDNHVGFLLYEKEDVYFIHSSYFEPVAVVRERASASRALATSQTFVMCAVSTNERLIRKWVTGEAIVVQ